METEVSVLHSTRSVYGHQNIRTTCIRLMIDDPGRFTLSCSIAWCLPGRFDHVAAIMGSAQPKPRHQCYSFLLVAPAIVPAGFFLTLNQLRNSEFKQVDKGPYALIYLNGKSKISGMARQMNASDPEPNVDTIVDYMQARATQLFYWAK